MIFVIISLLIIPITTKAICKCDINVDSKVEIEKINKFYLDLGCNNNNDDKIQQSLNDKLPVELKYIDGMTWDDYMNSLLFKKIDSELQQLIIESFNIEDLNMKFIPKGQEICIGEASNEDEIVNCESSMLYPTIDKINTSMQIQDNSEGKFFSMLYCDVAI